MPSDHLQQPEFDTGTATRLADWLSTREQQIVEAWTVAVRADPCIHSDESLSYPEFIDHIPKVVREICSVLRGGSIADEQQRIREHAREHGAFRWRQRYDLAEVMREIAHLRQVLIELLLSDQAGLPRAERPALLRTTVRVLDEGQVTTILTYVQERDRELAEREREIAQRDLTLAEQDRRHKQRLLEEERRRSEALESAARAKDDFLATLSHELRTPLTPILAWTTILEKNASPSTVAAAVRTIGRNANVLVQLIDDLLDVSRIVSGKLDYAREPLDVRDVVRAAYETVHAPAVEKGVRLRIEHQPRPLPIVGDAVRLQQVVWNLLSNAVKFSPSGGEVRMAAAVENREVVVAVEDDGEGIAPGFLPHIFDRFSQQDQKPTRGFGGLGLGLAIARAITQEHGGRLTAFSDGVGKGSRFELRLPLRRDERG